MHIEADRIILHWLLDILNLK